MRKSSVYIIFDDLVAILRKRGISLRKSDIEHLRIELHKARLKGRRNIGLKAGEKKKVEKVESTSEEFIELVQATLKLVRIKAGHKAITKIDPNSIDYTSLSNLASKIGEFAQLFNLPLDKDTVITYLGISMEFLGNKPFALNKLVNYHSRVCSKYGDRLTIAEDANEKLTEAICCAYCDTIKAKTGIDIDLIQADAVNFVFAAEECVKVKGTALNWVLAQFDGLAWTGNYPETVQLHGEAARKRYFKYMLAQGSEGVSGDYWNIIKKMSE